RRCRDSNRGYSLTSALRAVRIRSRDRDERTFLIPSNARPGRTGRRAYPLRRTRVEVGVVGLTHSSAVAGPLRCGPRYSAPTLRAGAVRGIERSAAHD
ncbi:MAG TPA: hypothetical protein VF018_14520, partial [Acidobacteriaceae bacterium]